MADKLIRAQVSLPNESAIPEDIVTNTFYFDGDDGNTDAAYHSAVSTMLTAFYVAMQDRISDHILSPLTCKLYDMRDAEPRVPEFTFPIVISRVAIDGLVPNEVALVLSFQADAVSGLIQARRRGRVYIGPICSTSNLIDTVGECRPTTAFLNDVASAASALATPLALAGTGSMSWAVYSPTTDATQSIDDAFNDVTNGWIDNSFDTQRRRGRDATARTLWT